MFISQPISHKTICNGVVEKIIQLLKTCNEAVEKIKRGCGFILVEFIQLVEKIELGSIWKA